MEVPGALAMVVLLGACAGPVTHDRGSHQASPKACPPVEIESVSECRARQACRLDPTVADIDICIQRNMDAQRRNVFTP